MSTPLFPSFDKRIGDAAQRILRNQVDPWAFMPQGLNVTAFDGRDVRYSGVGFEGTPRLVFWSNYIQPFLEDLAVTEISEAVRLAGQREVDARVLLEEVRGLLIAACMKVLARMADVDRRLRGKGFPQSVPLRSTQGELAMLTEFITTHVDGELKMLHKRSVESWWKGHRTAVEIATLVLAAIGTTAALVAI